VLAITTFRSSTNIVKDSLNGILAIERTQSFFHEVSLLFLHNSTTLLTQEYDRLISTDSLL
jgi:hypothetical protein